VNKTSYTVSATKNTPALIIYLLDMSYSMSAELDGSMKGDLVSKTLMHTAREMVLRSMKGTLPSPRYRVAIYVYNDEVRDVLNGPRLITELIEIGIPAMKPSGKTDTAAAFEAAERLLISEASNLYDCPAPLVCHLTDGEYTGSDPLPIVQRIQQITFPDGAALIENVIFDDNALCSRVTNPYKWGGVTAIDDLTNDNARHLFEMSSPIPQSYLSLFADRGYEMRSNARLLFPGGTPEMIEAAFTMSGMTPTTS
jgi:hypothetical protein